MPSKIAIVTGSNTGIGKEVALGLLRHDYNVVLACRRLDACEIARNEIMERAAAAATGATTTTTTHATAVCEYLDLEDFDSIRTFAEQQKNNNKIDLLVNNAGVMAVSPTTTTTTTTAAPCTGMERHFAINHIGTFLLTKRILPFMAEHGRIITVGSEAHRRGSLQDIRHHIIHTPVQSQPQKKQWWYTQYANSKLANCLMTKELGRRLQDSRSTIVTHCVSPGRVNTDIFRHLQGHGLNNTGSSSLTGWAIRLVANAFFQTPEQGASGIIKACVDEEFGSSGGEYIHLGRRAAPSAAVQGHEGAAVAKELWAWSEHYTTLQ